MGKYDDLIDFERPLDERFPPMAMSDRAAQFSPFAALTGYDEAVLETGRYTDSFCDPDEDVKNQINQKLMELNNNLDTKPEVFIEYFCQDDKKDGGCYVSVTGVVEKISVEKGFLVLNDGKIIDIKCIRVIDTESCS